MVKWGESLPHDIREATRFRSNAQHSKKNFRACQRNQAYVRLSE